jgi:hypothetical protein
VRGIQAIRVAFMPWVRYMVSHPKTVGLKCNLSTGSGYLIVTLDRVIKSLPLILQGIR